MLKRIVGAVIITLTIGTLGFWELWGRENIAYSGMLVLNEPVSANTVITADMLDIIKVSDVPEGALLSTQAERIIGKESAQYIPSGIGLYNEFFQESAFAVGKEIDKYILSVPSQWLESYPQSLRRGDRAYFYCKGKIVADAIVVYAKDANNQEVNSLDKDRLMGTSQVSLIEVIVDSQQMKDIGKLADEGNQFVVLYN